LFQYAVIELVYESKRYATPCLRSWLEDITMSFTKDNKELIVAKTCYWPLDENKLSLLLLQKSKPKADWLKLENIRVFAFCGMNLE